MSQNQRRRRQADLLGMPLSTAKNRLQKSLLFELLKHLGCNYCQKCGSEIQHPSDLSLHHVLPWEEEPELFWDLNNVRPECVECPNHGGKVMNNMKLVEVTLVRENGKKLPTYQKDGMIYFGGEKGERYEIHVRNRTGNRLEIVATVDGLSVMSGEPGDWREERGYILKPYESLNIEGYRRNEDEVAAFRFTNSDDPEDDSYAGRKDMPENLGVIGIAVFKEREYTIQPWEYWTRPIGKRYEERKYGRYGLRGTFLNANAASTGNIKKVKKGITPELDAAMESARETLSVDKPEIGTEYGEVLDSHVTTTHFTRHNSSNPDQVVMVEYDTVAGLKKRGITELAGSEKDAFPGMRGVKPGYAAPPPPRKRK